MREFEQPEVDPREDPNPRPDDDSTPAPSVIPHGDPWALLAKFQATRQVIVSEPMSGGVYIQQVQAYEADAVDRARHADADAITRLKDDHQRKMENLRVFWLNETRHLREQLQACHEFLKDGESPAACILRNRGDIESLMSLLAAEKARSGAAEAALAQQREEHERLQGDVKHRDDVIESLCIAGDRANADAVAQLTALTLTVERQREELETLKSDPRWHYSYNALARRAEQAEADLTQSRSDLARLTEEKDYMTASRDSLVHEVAELRRALRAVQEALVWAEKNLIALTHDDGYGVFTLGGNRVELTGFGAGLQQVRSALKVLPLPPPDPESR